MTIEIVVGDIAARRDDAIVNSANPTLLAGGGVSGAIHRAAGPELELACKQIGRCEVGEAVATPGFGLAAKHVIHAVAPRWLGGARGEPSLLRQCHARALDVAQSLGAVSIAFPAMGIGIYRYPLEAAAEIAVGVLRSTTLRVALVVFDEDIAVAYQSALMRADQAL